MTDLISIILPVYNCDQWLTDTIKSVQKQTYPNFELICVDDGSTDHSLEIIKRIMAKILDEILKSEATEKIKAKAYERSDERTNSRNGYRVRQLTTRVGTLELHVPKLRHGNFSTQLFKRYQHSEQPLIWH